MKFYSYLFIITFLISCKPDDSPCNGEGQDVFHELGEDQLFHNPFREVERYSYRRTAIGGNGAIDTINLIKIKSDSSYELIRTSFEDGCVVADWNVTRSYIYVDSVSRKDTTIFSVEVQDFLPNGRNVYLHFKGRRYFMQRYWGGSTNFTTTSITVLGKLYGDINPLAKDNTRAYFQRGFGVVFYTDPLIKLELIK